MNCLQGVFCLLVSSINLMTTNGEIPCTLENRCPPVFTRLNGRCYYFGNTPATWFEGWQQCALMGASLVSLETPVEWEIIYEQIDKLNPAPKNILNEDNKTLALTAAYWTSGTNLSGKNNWIWLGSGLPIFNTDWCPGQPDNKDGTERCIKLLTSGDKHCWNDRNCLSRDTATKGVYTFYICEINHPDL